MTTTTTKTTAKHIVRLGEVHPDMARYLHDDCYCPNEIYDITGFSFRLFPVESLCWVINQNEDMTAVVAVSPDDGEPDWENLQASNAQAILFWHDDDDGDNPDHRIIDSERYDATPNNIEILKDVVDGVKSDGTRHLDEYIPGSLARGMRKIASISGAVIID